MFWSLRLGLVSVWLTVVIVCLVLVAAFTYQGNHLEARITLELLGVVLVAWMAFRIGHFRGVGTGKRIAIRPFLIQASLDNEPSDWILERIDFQPDEFAKDVLGKIEEKNTTAKPTQLLGKTAKRLTDAIADFPRQYPEYAVKQPKLDEDVRPWLKATYGASEREAHVFGAIIAEHFGL